MSKRWVSWLALLCVAILGLTATAHADEPERSNAADAAGAALEQLPLPYAPWQGSGFAPPPPRSPRELSAPLARPPESARRPWELSAGLLSLLPSCAAGSFDDHGCSSVSAGAGFDAALLYRVSTFFGFGAEGALSGFGGRGRGPFSRSGGAAQFFAVTGRVYFADAGDWDPYVALALGYGSLALATSAERDATSGLGGRISGGIDYLWGAHLRVGAALGFAHWLAWSEESCSEQGICRRQPLRSGRLLGFASLGLRIGGSFGTPL